MVQVNTGMVHMFEIGSYVGDYPLEGQPFWNMRFSDFDKAKEKALIQHKQMLEKNPDAYTTISKIITDDVVSWLIHQDVEYDTLDEATAKADELANTKSNAA